MNQGLVIMMTDNKTTERLVVELAGKLSTATKRLKKQESILRELEARDREYDAELAGACKEARTEERTTVHTEMGELEKTVEKLQVKVQEAGMTMKDILFSFAVKNYERKNYFSARDALRAYVLVSPEDSEGHYYLGRTYIKLEDRSSAEDCFRRAVEANADHGHAHFYLGTILFGKNKTDEAQTCFVKAIEIDPQHGHAHFLLGMIYEKKGDKENAREYYRHAIETKSSHAEKAKVALEKLGEQT
jgi:TolA-binding protein